MHESVIARRIPQAVLVVSMAIVCWLWMQAAHEAGHVLHAWATGGQVQAVVLHPLSISFTDVRPNPRPLAVAWGGVIWGSLIPLSLWALMRLAASSYAWLARFFAGFCLIANGAYMASALWLPAGDSQTLIQLGMPAWLLCVVGAVLFFAGLWCWNGLGVHFGWKRTGGEVNVRVAWTVAAFAVTTFVVELVVSELLT